MFISINVMFISIDCPPHFASTELTNSKSTLKIQSPKFGSSPTAIRMSSTEYWFSFDIILELARENLGAHQVWRIQSKDLKRLMHVLNQWSGLRKNSQESHGKFASKYSLQISGFPVTCPKIGTKKACGPRIQKCNIAIDWKWSVYSSYTYQNGDFPKLFWHNQRERILCLDQIDTNPSILVILDPDHLPISMLGTAQVLRSVSNWYTYYIIYIYIYPPVLERSYWESPLFIG